VSSHKIVGILATSLSAVFCCLLILVELVQCLAIYIWQIGLKSGRPTNKLQVTSLGSGVKNGFQRMNLKKSIKLKTNLT
jgi:hypothetical protein